MYTEIYLYNNHNNTTGSCQGKKMSVTAIYYYDCLYNKIFMGE